MLTREQKLAIIYRHTHRDYKGKRADGVKSILTLRDGGTTSVPLSDLTDAEIIDKLPYYLDLEAQAELVRANRLKVRPDDLEAFAITTGELYEAHKALAGKTEGEWRIHVHAEILPRYCREVAPVYATGDTVKAVARALNEYYVRHNAESLNEKAEG